MDGFVLVPLHMVDPRSREGKESIGNGTDNVPVGLEGGIRVFNDGLAS